jgi:dipeptidyl aminopeptidase/acylaminoacyl peptidase
MIDRLRYLPLLFLLAHQHGLAATPDEMNRQIAMSRGVNEIALSPDGASVAAVITEPTVAGGPPHLWFLSKNRPPRQITGMNSSTVEDSNPVWMPDGDTLLYLEKAGDGAAVKRIALSSGRTDMLALARQDGTVAGGWNARVPGKPFTALGFAPSPSGALAVWATEGSDAAERAARKDDHHVFGQHDPVRLYVIDQQAPPREIALADDISSVTWSKDGSSLLVVTTPPSDDLGARNHVWLIERAAAPRELRGLAEDVQSLSWLPDGRVAYVARCSDDAPTVCHDLFVQALDGSPPRNLTRGMNGSLLNGVDNYARVGPIVTRSGDILVTIARRFGQQVALIRPADGRASWIGTAPSVVKAVSTNADRNGFALLAAERGGMATVRLADPQLRHHARVAVPELQPADWRRLRGQRLEWNSDGNIIDGMLYLPEGAAPGRRAPLIVHAHGGPAGRFEDSDYPLVRLLLAEGWAVLQVNPRGSFGYGTKFLAALRDDLGGGDYRDIMTGLDTALATAPVDKDRLAIIGFSYGGTMAGFALGRSDRFKAVIAASPVIDQISEYGTESSSWYDRWYFGQPWRRLEAAWRQSPLAGVATARTPVLLLHGENDPSNPTGQSLEFYRALRQEGSPVELILFPRETHHELGKNFFGFPSVEPYHGVALRQRMLDFLRDAFSGKPRAGLAANAPEPEAKQPGSVKADDAGPGA